jgi:hypothetical protein
MVLVSNYAICRELACRRSAEKFAIRECVLKISVPETVAGESQNIERKAIRV